LYHRGGKLRKGWDPRFFVCLLIRTNRNVSLKLEYVFRKIFIGAHED
jgi:hypothetical protein